MSSPNDAVAGGAFDPAPCAHGCLLHLGRGRDPPNPRVPVHLPRSPHLWTDRTARGPFRRRTPAHGETEPGRLGRASDPRSRRRTCRRQDREVLPLVRHTKRTDDELLHRLRRAAQRPDDLRDKGLSALGPSRPVMGLAFTNLLELEDLARAKVPRPSFDYIAGGAEDEVSLRRNREAFAKWALRPRVLVDVSKRDTSTSVLGQRVSMPILVAPTAFHGLVHPEGEVATARGAAAAGTLMVVSAVATKDLEEVAKAGAAPRWFQLYVWKDRDVTAQLVKRAVKAGYGAICLTVDTPVLGRREKDERNAFTLPPGLSIANVRPAGLAGLPASERGSAFAKYVAELLDPAVTWRDIAWLRSLTSLPIVLKGILTAEDATLAVEHGVDGIIVSNHGGRQLDSTVGTLDALPDIVAAVQGRVEVFMDGGVRRGTDVLKALALGAKAVLIGRSSLWGLALGGADGVRRVLEHLRGELELAMALTGRAALAQVDRSLIQRV